MEEQNKEPIVAERKLEKEIMPKRTEDLEDSETNKWRNEDMAKKALGAVQVYSPINDSLSFY